MKRIFIPALISFVLSFIFISVTSDQQDQKISGAFKALNYFSDARAYPFDDLPQDAIYSEFIKEKNLKRKLSTDKNYNAWESIGPSNMGGRTLALALNPLNSNTLYAGSASGGLWVSYTAGRGADAWRKIETGFPVLGVMAIAIDPSDTNKIFIGTGEVYNYQETGTGAAVRLTRGSYGIGILQSKDGGTSWEKSLDWSYNQKRGVQAIKINPINPSTIWAATTEGVYVSYDTGTNWILSHSTIMASDLVIHNADTNIVIAVHGNFRSAGYGMYRTTNAGDTWNKINSGVPSDFGGKAQLTICDDQPNIIYAGFGNGYFVNSPDNASWLCKSTNAGESWEIVSNTDYSRYQGWFAHDVAVNPNDPDEVFAIGINIYKSENGGNFLAQKSQGGAFAGFVQPGEPEGPPVYSHVDHHDVIYDKNNPNIVYFANDGGVFRTTNGGSTFEGCNGGYQTSQFYAGFSTSVLDSNFSIGGLQDNGTIIYAGTKVWNRYVIGGDGCWTGISTIDDNIVFGSYQGLNVLRSTNRGSLFSSISIPSSNAQTVFVAPFVLSPSNPMTIYAGRNKVYKSINYGISWTVTNNGLPLQGNPVLTMAAALQSSDVVYAATAPISGNMGVYVTTNGGDNWIYAKGNLPERYPGDLCVDPVDESIAYITLMGFGTSHLFRTTNYGIVWEDIGSGLPDVPANAVVVDPVYPEIIYVGNDLGVYYSTDTGANWNSMNDGFIDAVMVFDLSISPTNRKLRAATHGNGAYETDLIDRVVNVDDNLVVENFSLKQNYPNPFNPSTTIAFSLSSTATLNLIIYDHLGREVKKLIDSERFNPGYNEVIWNGKNKNGINVASGVYYYRLSSDQFSETKNMVLLR